MRKRISEKYHYSNNTFSAILSRLAPASCSHPDRDAFNFKALFKGSSITEEVNAAAVLIGAEEEEEEEEDVLSLSSSLFKGAFLLCAVVDDDDL
jgi:hypothetical protein